jgi:hypothetical protein
MEELEYTEENYADDQNTEWLEGFTEMEAECRHYLLDLKGVSAVRHWFDREVQDQKGRLDPETGTFYYMDEDGEYRFLTAVPIRRYSDDRFALLGTDGILGEVVVCDVG